MKALLSSGGEATSIAQLVRGILDECGAEIGDIQTSWAGDAKDLVEIPVGREPAPLRRILVCPGVRDRPADPAAPERPAAMRVHQAELNCCCG